MRTYCNPLNLNYNLQPPNSGGSRNNPSPPDWWFREAADPSVVIFADEYYLFSSVTKGYWVSPDLVDWEFIALADWAQLPNLRQYAPTAVVIDDVLYLAPGNSRVAGVFKTTTPRDPASWTEMPGTGYPATGVHYADAQFFYDQEFERLYYAYGCSPDGYIHIQELNKNTMQPEGFYHKMLMANPDERGWERPGGPCGNHDVDESHGWVEGAQILKHNGRYYWIYSLPDLGNAYCNGVFVADRITGPWTFQPANPCTQKLTGFAPGAGHGEIFQDKHGNWWTATCQNIWRRERFERRINLFPTWIDAEGQLMTDTWLGDYPIRVPDQPVTEQLTHLWSGCHLLSYDKPAMASSALAEHPAAQAFDEDIRTWWSAVSGTPGEWLQVDLLQTATVCAVQVNFAEQSIRQPDDPSPYIAYQLLGSVDGQDWQLLVDKKNNRTDVPHDYVQLPQPARASYLRLVNCHMPFGGNFAVCGLRIFGQGGGAVPALPAFTVVRDPQDGRQAKLEWEPVAAADGYVIRYGIKPGELFHSQQIYGATEHLVRGLNRSQGYFFTVDAFNANGYAQGKAVLPA